jgi:hypothetical protein
MQQCRIRKFDPSTMKSHRITMVIARRGSGKTTLLRDLLYHQRDRLDFVLGMCPTVEAADMMRECMPASSVFDRFMPNKIEQMVQVARDLVAKGKTRSFGIVCDDCMYDKSIFRSTSMRSIFFNGRHHRMTLMTASQYAVSIGPDLRSQVDYVFALKDNVLSNRMNLWRMFFGVFGTFEDFQSVFDACTQNFECLVLDNTLQTTKVTDCVFWYRAEPSVPTFRVGRPIYFRLDQSTRLPAQEHATVQDDDPLAMKGKRRLAVVKEEAPDDA